MFWLYSFTLTTKLFNNIAKDPHDDLHKLVHMFNLRNKRKFAVLPCRTTDRFRKSLFNESIL